MDQTTPPCFTLAPGEGDLPKITLVAPDGSQAEIYLHGAHVASWAPANDAERLFMSEASAFSAGAPIRGGIPLVFPQFGANGPLPNHGFARILPWEFLGAQVAGNTATAIFHLVDSPETRALWDHAFAAELSVAVGGNGLGVTLEIDNTGHEPFSFTTALHTYLRVADLAETYVQGLGDRTYRDLPAGGIEAVPRQRPADRPLDEEGVGAVRVRKEAAAAAVVALHPGEGPRRLLRPAAGEVEERPPGPRCVEGAGGVRPAAGA